MTWLTSGGQCLEWATPPESFDMVKVAVTTASSEFVGPAAIEEPAIDDLLGKSRAGTAEAPFDSKFST